MFISVAFIGAAAAVGAQLIRFFDQGRRFSLLERVSGSVVLGIAIASYVALIGAVLSGSLTIGIAAFCIVATIAVAATVWQIVRKFGVITRTRVTHCFVAWFRTAVRVLKSFRKLIAVIALLGILIIVTAYILSIFSYAENGSLRSITIGWGDTAFHINLIERFAHADPFTLDHPLVAGEKLRYPFLIDFISGALVYAGADLVTAYHTPLVALTITALILLFSVARRMLHSNGFAALAVAIVIFGSGTGFLTLANDLWNGYETGGVSGIADVVTNPPHEYTHLDSKTGGKPGDRNTDDNIVWIVPLVSFLSHQRGFPFGYAITLFAILGFIRYGREHRFARYGVIVGFLPLAHGHSFMAVFLIFASFAILCMRQWKMWMHFALLTALVAFPQLIALGSGAYVTSGAFLKPWLGWMTCSHGGSWFRCDSGTGGNGGVLLFWIKNFGIVFLVWIVALMVVAESFILRNVQRAVGHLQKRFLVVSAVLFVVPNMFLLQPWDFDNGKLLFYWWTFAVIAGVVPLFMWLWRRGFLLRGAVVILVVLGTAAGGFDVGARLFTDIAGSPGYADGRSENIALAAWIKKRTKPNARFLTGSEIDPTPTFLAGRLSFLGYEGWFWSHGLDISRLRRDGEAIVQGDAERACLVGVDYVIIDASLRNRYKQEDMEPLLRLGKIVFSQQTLSGNREVLAILCSIER